MGQKAAKEAADRTLKVAKPIAKFVPDPTGPGAAVLRSFDQHLKNKQKWGVAAEDLGTIAERVQKHGQKQSQPGAEGSPAPADPADTAQDLLKRKLKAREPRSTFTVSPVAPPKEPSAAYHHLQEVLRGRLGAASSPPTPEPPAESSDPSTPIRKVSRIPKKQASVLTSSAELGHGARGTNPQDTAVDPTLKQGLRTLSMFKRKTKTVMGQKQTNISLERVAESAAMSDAAWFAMLFARRARDASFAEVEAKCRPVPAEIVRAVCTYFDAPDVHFFPALHNQAQHEQRSLTAPLPGPQLLHAGGYHVFPAPPIPVPSSTSAPYNAPPRP